MLKQFQNSIGIVLANRTWVVGDNQVKMCYVLLNGTIRYVFERQLRDLL
jgi:hypothetical protein